MNIAHAGARAICGINSIPMQVVDQNNSAFIGRPIAGISGNPITNLPVILLKTLEKSSPKKTRARPAGDRRNYRK